jgi:putative transposase
MARRPSRGDGSTPLSAEQVRRLATESLVAHLPLGLDGYRYGDADIYAMLVAAAAQRRSLESVCRHLVAAPSANLVRQYLTERLFEDLELETLEAHCNALLVERLPAGVLGRPLRVAIDLTLRPYYGKVGRVPDQLRRGEAKAGTTRFHAYATAYVLHAGRRVTLAVTFVYAEEALADVLADLVGRVRQTGVTLQRLFLDREFASVAVLDWLQHQPFVTVVALPKRGAALKALLTGRASYRTTYTMRSDDWGAVTFPLWVACRYAAGRRGRHGREYLAFAVVGQPGCAVSVRQLADEYRQRFGIESRYRQAEQVRVPTTSRDPALRLLLVSLSLLLTNLWVWLKTQVLTLTPRRDRPAARAWLDAAFRLDAWRDLLIEALTTHYGVRHALPYPFPLARPLKL